MSDGIQLWLGSQLVRAQPVLFRMLQLVFSIGKSFVDLRPFNMPDGTKLTSDEKASVVQCVRSWYANVETDSYVLSEEQIVKGGMQAMLSVNRLEDVTKAMPWDLVGVKKYQKKLAEFLMVHEQSTKFLRKEGPQPKSARERCTIVKRGGSKLVSADVEVVPVKKCVVLKEPSVSDEVSVASYDPGEPSCSRELPLPANVGNPEFSGSRVSGVGRGGKSVRRVSVGKCPRNIYVKGSIAKNLRGSRVHGSGVSRGGVVSSTVTRRSVRRRAVRGNVENVRRRVVDVGSEKVVSGKVSNAETLEDDSD